MMIVVDQHRKTMWQL